MTDAAHATATAATTGCVHCHEPLVLCEHEGIQVLACGRGHGVFLHADALQAAVRDRTADRPEHEERAAEAAQGSVPVEQLEASEDARTCPTCGAPMAKRVFAYESGVTTDVCDEHGVWLDDGELHRIEAWVEAQERHVDADRATWGGATGRLEQLEQQHERKMADEVANIHWGPVGWLHSRTAYWWFRRDDR